MTVKFYSRPNCELCNKGMALLKLVQEDAEFSIEVFNIEEDDTLHERFMVMIPVVEHAGEIIQYGRLDYITLYEALVAR